MLPLPHSLFLSKLISREVMSRIKKKESNIVAKLLQTSFQPTKMLMTTSFHQNVQKTRPIAFLTNALTASLITHGDRSDQV